MEKEQKELLIIDLCARLPYGVKVHIKGEYKTPRKVYNVYIEDKTITYFKGFDCIEEDIENVKPYLRPMSSMTNKEREEYRKFSYYGAAGIRTNDNSEMVGVPSFEKMDYLISHHFDFRGLIPKGLAIEAPKDMYNIK